VVDRPANGRALEDQYARLDALDAKVRAAKTLDGRRKLAQELFPVLADTDRAMRDDARRTGEDARMTGLRCDEHVRVFLATLRDPCGWNFEELLREYSTTTSSGRI
jgi:hypothetical protein